MKIKVNIINKPWKTRRFWTRKPFTTVKGSAKKYNRKKSKSQFQKEIERALG